MRLTQRELFAIFFRAGWGFGGGLGVLALLEDELITRRGLVTRDELRTLHGMGRIVPSGTMTGVAVACGYRFGGLAGTVVALTAMVLPAFTLIVALTIGYDYLRASPLFGLLPFTLLPAAIAIIVRAALRLGQDIFRPSRELAVAAAAFALTLLTGFSPVVLLLAGGLLGTFLFKGSPRAEDPGDAEANT
jgi:chromate transporter